MNEGAGEEGMKSADSTRRLHIVAINLQKSTHLESALPSLILQ